MGTRLIAVLLLLAVWGEQVSGNASLSYPGELKLQYELSHHSKTCMKTLK